MTSHSLTRRPIVQKSDPYRDKEMTALARDIPCKFTFPHECRGDTMACHANWSRYGKGVHIKVSDFLWAAGCLTAHREIDGKINPTMSREEREAAWLEAFISTWDQLLREGKVIVA